ncbi:MAG: glycosyltransferase [Candidatus Paceibacterota bacterium]|jgi:glycosyltransferase involved in cell wall biosynthesis
MTKKQKRVFICITKSNWGGAQKYVFDIARELSKNKDVKLSILLGGNGELKNKLRDINIDIITIENSQRDLGIIKDVKFFFELLKLFKKEKPEVIHLNSSKMGFIGGLAGRISGVKKIIFTAHGWAFNEDRNFLQKKILIILHILTIILSHKTIAVSDIVKKQIGNRFNKKIIVIKNGIAEINFIDKKSARESLSIKILQKNQNVVDRLTGNPIWIGTISELHKNKGLEYAIEAISKVKENIIFVIIGEGEERKKLEELSIKLGSSNKIFLIGKIENASSYIKAFDIFTLTSITEALPYVLLEAGKAELPVIASNVGGIPEIIENNISGILTSTKNSEEIKNSILQIISNTEKIKYLSHSLNKKINKDFKENDMLKKTFEVYNI